MKKRPAPSKSQQEEFYKAYEDYAKALRTWFVAYGIGFPILVLTNAGVSNALAKSGQSKLIVQLFVIGMACQVLIAIINKVCMWINYHSEMNVDNHDKWWAKASYWLGNQFWIDVTFDIASLVAFSLGTIKLFNVYFPPTI